MAGVEDILREVYGEGYEPQAMPFGERPLPQGYDPPGPAGDPNSLGYAMHGPVPTLSTANHLNLMRAAAEEEAKRVPTAISNLAVTGATLGMPGVAAASRLARTPIRASGAPIYGST